MAATNITKECPKCGKSFRVPWRGQTYCSLLCHQTTRYAGIAERLDKKTEHGSPGGCSIWTGSTDRRGYGQISWNDRIWLVHRVAWTLKNGDIPERMEICHRCDNPPCVNVDHLFVGTHLDNMRDMDSKGRRVVAVPKGEDHGCCKLTIESVHLIRKATGSQINIAREFGIGQTTVSAIKRGKSWSHIPFEGGA